MKRFALLLLLALPAAAASQRPGPADGSPVGPDGTRAAIDLPAGLHMRNTGGIGPRGPGTGAGLCVFTSVEVAARWHGLHEIDGFQKWMTHKPGGGYPQKLAAMLEEFCASKGVKVPDYVQATGRDPRLMELAFKTRRCVAMTWTPAHMLNGMHLDGSRGCIVDNNAPGHFQWMTRQRFLSTWSAGNYGWVVIWLAPPPPPGPDALAPAPGPAPKPPPSPPPCPGPNCPRWVPVTYGDGTTVQKLYDGEGRFLGVWSERGWHPAVSPTSWLAHPQGEPPVPPPAAAEIDWSKIDTTRSRYWLNGHEVPAEVAYGAVEQVPPGALVDDSGRPHLTVTGADKAAVAGLLGDAASKVHLQVYTADDWPVKYGRVKPGVTLQAPAPKGGKVLYAAAYSPAAVAEAVKYADPDYVPVAPAPRPKPKPAPTPEPAPAPKPVVPAPEPDPVDPPTPVIPPPPDAAPKPTPAGGNGIAALIAAFVFWLMGSRKV